MGCQFKYNAEESDPVTGIDKQLVASSFGHAAATYDALAGLQKEVGVSLIDLLTQKITGSRVEIADIGCGTGWLTYQLRSRFPQASITGVDLAEGMVEFARAHQQEAAEEWLVGDMESIPLTSDKFDAVYSNMAMQWLEDPANWFCEADRILKPGGWLICSTLLQGTLSELQASWEEADKLLTGNIPATHVNQFQTRQQLSLSIAKSIPKGEFQEQTWVRHYASVKDIMGELKGIGAHNLNADRPQGITGKTRIRRMMNHYEIYRQPQGLPTTYKVAFIAYRKPFAD
ncbi:malonyl-[acyl-carrier protein] O-methyltransferase BioC [Hahella sp. CCB-MM4]|uniref:malonyl-ACP O-methyltransferase BioC n=1 Tax=Hahella sp. (strain CCB-MM4) TaxID=1926491 RepID=UPI000BD32E45|nr:malonyl-ACP O-methyltransferase BioC [Hahella sp. CCB-MM4]OZG71512.1 malonyl-[acyl-carrier protein] O-methyltransferase BioC [Hahella sp. CCB-MM4]